MEENMYMCTICKKDFPMDMIKYRDDGKGLTCKNCYTKARSGELQKPKSAFSDPKEEPVKPKKVVVISSGDSKDPVKFVCRKCNYKFNIKKSSPSSKRCPYCGGTNITQEINAEDLLRELSEDTGLGRM